MSNKELTEKLHKSIIRKCNERKFHSHSIENIWGVDPAKMQLISKFNKGFRFVFRLMLLIIIVNMHGLFF